MSIKTVEIKMSVLSTVLEREEFRTSPNIAVGDKFTYESNPELENPEEGRAPRFSYLKQTGEIVTFSLYDLNAFTFNGKLLKDYFKAKAGADPQIAEEFTIKSLSPVSKDFKVFTGKLPAKGDSLTSPKLAYPLFSYKGWDDYKEKRDGLEDGKRMSRADRKICRSTNLMEEYRDRHYRTLDIDTPLLWFPD